MHEALRAGHYSYLTEKAYVSWIRRYIRFHGCRHPRDMGAAEITTFLTYLATEGNVAASTQNQALNAILFLYRKVLGIDLPSGPHSLDSAAADVRWNLRANVMLPKTETESQHRTRSA